MVKDRGGIEFVYEGEVIWRGLEVRRRCRIGERWGGFREDIIFFAVFLFCSFYLEYVEVDIFFCFINFMVEIRDNFIKSLDDL